MQILKKGRIFSKRAHTVKILTACNAKQDQTAKQSAFLRIQVREQSNKRSGTRLKRERERDWGETLRACEARPLPISLLILRKTPTVLQSKTRPSPWFSSEVSHFACRQPAATVQKIYILYVSNNKGNFIFVFECTIVNLATCRQFTIGCLKLNYSKKNKITKQSYFWSINNNNNNNNNF